MKCSSFIVVLMLGAGLLTYGQSSSQQTSAPSSTQGSAQPQAAASAVPGPTAQQPATTLRTSSRMVTVEVVARDHHGEAVSGLTADDFQVFEQIASKREQRPQKIAAFHAVSVTEIAAQDQGKVQLPAGVYANLVTMQKVPVPPTVLLVDGLNTDRASQMQVHRQMIHMLASIPDDVPVSVFLLGRRLKMIQNFTTDPKLLKAALQKTSSAESDSATQVEPQDDPDALSAFLEDSPNLPAGSLTAIEQFEREVYATQMDTRVRETLEALRAIARHVAGYPGRKNLLWISSSFPISINPDVDLGFAGIRSYQNQMADVANALADAKVAVYPMDPAGLQVQTAFQASTRMRGNPVTGRNSIGRSIEREDQSRFNRQSSMQALADQTGGIICVNNNDLGDCVRKAVKDGSAFYEIAYYPDSSDWHGEFHKITVKSTKSGMHLAYRQGYFGRPEGDAQQKSADLQEAACQDLLTSTSVLMVAKQYPADQPGKAKYFMAIYPSTVTFVPQSDGSRDLALKVGVCTFDKFGKPLQFMQEAVDAKLTDKQFASVQAQHGFPHAIVLAPGPGTTAVRLLVQDVATGQLGSVNVPYTELSAQAAAPPAGGVAPAQPAH